MADSNITLHAGGGVSFEGPDAIHLAQLIVTKGAIKLHRDTGMIPTRGMTISRMLAAVSAITGKTYTGKGKHDAAIADIETRIQAMRATLPVADLRKRETA